MRKQSANELGRLASVQSEAMNDLCNIYQVSFASGTYGTQITETRSFRHSGTPCGIEFTDGQVQRRNEVAFVEYDCILRLSDATPVLMSDEIDLVEKGEFLISGTFKPASYPVVSSSVQHVKLKRIVP